MAQEETSVLFSLKELMGLEQERIEQEKNAKRRAEQVAFEAELALERQRQDAHEAEVRAVAEKRRLEEQRGREELARVEAIRLAEMERARLEVETRARLEALAQSQQYEKDIAAISQDRSKKNLKRLAGVAGALLLVVAVGASLYVRDAQAKQRVLEARLASAQSDLDENTGRIARLTQTLEAAKGNAKEQAEIKEQIEALKARNAVIRGQLTDKQSHTSGAVVTTAPTVPPAPKIVCRMSDGTRVPSCHPHDPLCACD